LEYPNVKRVNGQDEVFVGLIRADLSVPQGLQLWIVADNLRRGAALSAVQIAEHLCQNAPG
jgi:aspartate-semialdehyde dehydrogenase